MLDLVCKLHELTFLLPVQIVEELEGNRDDLARITELVDNPIKLAMITNILSQFTV